MYIILLVIAAIGGFIKIIETTVKIVKYLDIVISNFKCYRRMDRKLKEMEKEAE